MIELTSETCVALVDSVGGEALAPTFASEEHARDFLAWSARSYPSLPDPRHLRYRDLMDRVAKWKSQRLDLEGELLPERTSNAAALAGGLSPDPDRGL